MERKDVDSAKYSAMSSQVPITATHRGRSRRIVVEPIRISPRKRKSAAPKKTPAKTKRAA